MELDFSFFGYSPKPKEKKPSTPRITFKGSSKLTLKKINQSRSPKENTHTTTMPVVHKKTLILEETIVIDDTSESAKEISSNSDPYLYKIDPAIIVLYDSSDDCSDDSATHLRLPVKKPSKVTIYSTSETSSSKNSFRLHKGSTLCDRRKVVIESSSEIEDEEPIVCDATIEKHNDLPILSLEKERDIHKWLNEHGISDNDIESYYDATKKRDEEITTPIVQVAGSKDSKDREEVSNPLPDAVNALLDDLYGPIWKSAKKTTVGSSSESDDSFDKMMKKYMPKENRPPALPKTKSSRTPLPPPINRKLLFDPEEEKISIALPKPIPKINNPSKPFTAPLVKNCTGTKPRNIPKTKVVSTTNLPLRPVAGNTGLKLRSFLESLSPLTPIPWCDPKALDFRNNFKTKREELTQVLYKLFNENIFARQLPADMLVEWNVRLNKTAGYCYNRSCKSGKTGVVSRSSRIEISTKVCNSADRLRDTLVHEMCHAANWIVSGISNGHGQSWKAWANSAMRCYQELPVIARCHNYKIDTKYTYKCTACGYSIHRHSKSIDIEAKRCGYCRGTFELLVNPSSTPKRGGTAAAPRTPKAPTGFALYVKDNYGSVKKDRDNLKHGDVMKLLGQQFSATKISN